VGKAGGGSKQEGSLGKVDVRWPRKRGRADAHFFGTKGREKAAEGAALNYLIFARRIQREYASPHMPLPVGKTQTPLIVTLQRGTTPIIEPQGGKGTYSPEAAALGSARGDGY